jgi:hypothetical protein
MLNLLFGIAAIAITYKVFEPILGSDIWWMYLAIFLWKLEMNINLKNDGGR